MPQNPPEPSPDEEAKGFSPSAFQRRIGWTALTSICVVVIGAIAVGGVMLFSWGLGYLQPLLVPVAVAGIMAYLLEPVVIWLTRKGMKRRRAVKTVFAAFCVLVVVLAFMVVYPTIRQGREFWQEYLTPNETIAAEAVERYNTEEVPWLATTELGRSGGRLLDFVDRKLGDLAFIQQFKDDENKEKWDIGEITNWLWSHVSGFMDEVATFFGRGFSSAASMLGYVLGFAIVPIYLFVFLQKSTQIARNWSNYLPLWESDLKKEIVDVLQEINQYLVAYFRGQMLVSMIDAALITIALCCIQLPYALLLGVFLAILGMIPYLGSLFVMIPAGIIAIVHFGAKETVTAEQAAKCHPDKLVTMLDSNGVEVTQVYINTWDWLPNQIWIYVAIVIGLFILLQQINGWFTAPKIVGDSVGLHPVTVIVSMFFWSMLLGGLLGALLAVPLTASIKVLFRRYIWETRVTEHLPAPPKEPAKKKQGDGKKKSAS